MLDSCPALRYPVVANGVDLNLFHPAPAPSAPRRTDSLPGGGPADRAEGAGRSDPGFCAARAGPVPPRDRGRRAGRTGTTQPGRAGTAWREEIRFLGSLDRDGVAQRYRDADLFTLPSTAEAFGNVFAEALASGLPIVGSSVGGIPELVEHGSNGLLVPPGDPAGLASAIRYLADDPELRAEMAVRNRAKAEATLEWPSATKRYLAIYESVQSPGSCLPSLVPEPTVSIR